MLYNHNNSLVSFKAQLFSIIFWMLAKEESNLLSKFSSIFCLIFSLIWPDFSSLLVSDDGHFFPCMLLAWLRTLPPFSGFWLTLPGLKFLAVRCDGSKQLRDKHINSWIPENELWGALCWPLCSTEYPNSILKSTVKLNKNSIEGVWLHWPFSQVEVESLHHLLVHPLLLLEITFTPIESSCHCLL